ncbi:MAG: hypothetical protein AAF799_30420 [Myxococcota bacterium]
MPTKKLSLSDLRKVRGGAETAAGKKTTAESKTGLTKTVCDCTFEKPH